MWLLEKSLNPLSCSQFCNGWFSHLQYKNIIWLYIWHSVQLFLPRIYLSGGWYFNTVVIELNRSSPLIHYFVISHVIDWNYLQVQLLGKFTQSYQVQLATYATCNTPFVQILFELRYLKENKSVMLQGFISYRLNDLTKYRKYTRLRDCEGVYIIRRKNGVPAVTQKSAITVLLRVFYVLVLI